jgi:nucleoside-diphosphate-sugar epimerase
VADPARAREELGWRAAHAFADGFRSTAAWFDADAPLARYEAVEAT